MHDANVRSGGERGLKRAASPSRRRLRRDPRACPASARASVSWRSSTRTICARSFRRLAPAAVRSGLFKDSFTCRFRSDLLSKAAERRVRRCQAWRNSVPQLRRPDGLLRSGDAYSIKGNDDSTCICGDDQSRTNGRSSSISGSITPKPGGGNSKKIADPKDKMQAPTNERQEKRLEVLDWKRGELPFQGATQPGAQWLDAARKGWRRAAAQVVPRRSRVEAPHQGLRRKGERVGQVGLGKATSPGSV